MMKKGWILGLAALMVISGCVDRGAQKQAKETEKLVSDPSVAVQVEAAKMQSIQEELEITGTIATGEDTQIGAKSGGRLVAVYIKDGDRVSPGQVIAQQETTDQTARLRQAMASADAARSQVRQAEEDALVGPRRSATTVRASRSRVEQARAQLAKVQSGARSEERRQADAAVRSAKTNLDTAKTDRDRYRNLVKEGAASQQDLDRAENAYASALAQYENALENQRMMQNGSRTEDVSVAREQLRQAEEQLRNDLEQKKLDVQYTLRVQQARANLQSAQEAVTIAQQAIGDATIRAPFSGTIVGKPLQVGTFAAPGTPIARLVGGGGTYLEGEIPESELPNVKIGSPVIVTTSTSQGAQLEGVVTSINPQGSEVGRLFKVRIDIREGGAQLRPGMFARAKIVVRTIQNAVTVPAEAVVRSGTDNYVFLFANGKAKRLKVTLGPTRDGRVQVNGVQANEAIIVRGQTKLDDGSAVKMEAKGDQLKTETKGA